MPGKINFYTVVCGLICFVFKRKINNERQGGSENFLSKKISKAQTYSNESNLTWFFLAWKLQHFVV